jgi:hypothetical protein
MVADLHQSNTMNATKSRSENQEQTIRILKEKIAKNPNSPKIQKWKKLLENTERDRKMEQVTKKKTSSRSYLTKEARAIHDNVLDAEVAQIRKEYLHTVLYPDNYAYRMPDELTQPTMLYKSIREFNLLANMDGTVNAGRFSFAVKPILGSLDKRHHYQVGIIDNSQGWPTHYDDDSVYVKDNLYTDPRYDPMAAQLTNPDMGYFSASSNGHNIPTFAVGDYYNLTPGTDANGQIGVDPGSSINVDYIPLPTSPFVLDNGMTIHANSGGNFVFSVPTGVYSYSPIFTIGGTWTTTSGSPNYALALIALDKNFNVAGVLESKPGNDIVSGIFAGNSYFTYEHDSAIWNVNQGLLVDERVNVMLYEDYYYVPLFSIVGNAVNNVTIGFDLAPTRDVRLPAITNSGSIIKLRPVGLSCLVTCMLPEINAGGNIVAMSCPSGDIDNYFYQTSAQMGPYQEWACLARTNKGNLLHDGNFKDGSYTWSQPWDKNDCLMRTPTESLDYKYQGIIVSGQLNPSVALSGLVNCGRIRIAIVYEYTTDNRLFNPHSCLGSTADLDWVLAYLGQQQHSTENSDHLAVIKNILKKGAEVVSYSVPKIVKAANLAGQVAALMI